MINKIKKCFSFILYKTDKKITKNDFIVYIIVVPSFVFLQLFVLFYPFSSEFSVWFLSIAIPLNILFIMIILRNIDYKLRKINDMYIHSIDKIDFVNEELKRILKEEQDLLRRLSDYASKIKSSKENSDT